MLQVFLGRSSGDMGGATPALTSVGLSLTQCDTCILLAPKWDLAASMY